MYKHKCKNAKKLLFHQVYVINYISSKLTKIKNIKQKELKELVNNCTKNHLFIFIFIDDCFFEFQNIDLYMAAVNPMSAAFGLVSGALAQVNYFYN